MHSSFSNSVCFKPGLISDSASCFFRRRRKMDFVEKEEIYLSTGPGMLPLSLSNFSSDAEFIERAARFSCFVSNESNAIALIAKYVLVVLLRRYRQEVEIASSRLEYSK
ncbi:hypothetical protein M5K25_005847 [Dendrobium thyrsiflorum]|uniref:Uncharacterized protein n=1 Tax=Dendrobium thyrsiflorum TaxID=117978 RepID=A0ABD0V9Y4_DENTH